MRFALPILLVFSILSILSVPTLGQGVPQEWHLSVKNDQWAYMRAVLGKQPFDDVAPLMSVIIGQMNAQIAGERAAADADQQKRVDDAVKKALEDAKPKPEAKPDAPVGQ